MRKFATFLIATILLSMIASALIQVRFDGPYPQRLGPEFDELVRYNHQEYLNNNEPEIMMLGDSTLKDSVLFDQLGETLDKDVYGVAIPGSTTALWYLILKNNVITAEHKPEVMVIYTRESMMTTPYYRVDGGYFATIDEYAYEEEPLLLERSYLQEISPVEQAAARWLPLFSQRNEVRNSLNYRIDLTLPLLAGCGEACVIDVLDRVFLGEVDKQAVLTAQNQSENFLWEMPQLLFNRQLQRSYLPEIERMTRENDIQLVLIEMKTFRSPPSTTTALLLDAYMRGLRGYCDENNIVYISFSDDERLTQDLFKDGFHLGEKAMPMFTDMLAQELAEKID